MIDPSQTTGEQSVEAAIGRFFDGAVLSIMGDERLTVDEKLEAIEYMAGERLEPPAWVVAAER